jgi:ADP-ribosyl-[dinitrogen reductase] hydrolase
MLVRACNGCGQVAGAYYGETSIPSHWLKQLAMRQEITNLAVQLHATAE